MRTSDIKYLLIILIFINTSCTTTEKTVILNEGSKVGSVSLDKNRNYLEDSKMYFNFNEYEKAIDNALLVYRYVDDRLQKEEALYIINESAEEIVQELDRRMYIESFSNIRKRIRELKSQHKITIKLNKIGYQYILYYDKAYYKKLKKLNPDSEYIKKIELKHIARMGQFVTNPAYRFKQIINVTEKYWNLYKANPDIEYAPDILVRIADLYLYLYEEGINVKRELGLTQRDLRHYYDEANRLYQKLKDEFPNSAAAASVAYVIDSVRIRQEPRTKSKVLKRVKAGTLVKILDRSDKKMAISNMYAYWYKVKLISGLEGWVYGF